MLKLPLFSCFKLKQQPLIGIDISNSAVKLLEIHSHANQHLEVASYGIAPLASGAVADRRIQDPKSVALSLRKAIERSKPTTNLAAVAVPTSMVMTRTLSLPLELSDAEVEAQVMLEADQHISYPLHEIALDFQRQAPLNSSDDHQPVLLVACRKEITEQLDSILIAAKLKPKVIDVESFALERSVGLVLKQISAKASNNKLIALIDFGATHTTLNVLKQGVIIYSRDQAFGGNQLTQEIQRAYNLASNAAELAKKTGSLSTTYQKQVLQPFQLAFTEQLHRQIQLFFSSTNYSSLDSLILAGGSAAIQGLAALVHNHLGYPTFTANPLAKMQLSNQVDAQALAQDAPALMLACGLAMRACL